MPSQFLRLTGFPKEAGLNARKHEHGAGMLAEAWRLKGSTPHIRHPKPPNQIFGYPQEIVASKLEKFSLVARDPRGAPLKRSSIVIYAIVVSYPIPWRDLSKQEDLALYIEWRTRTLDWLKSSFPERLEAVLEHVDERYPHLHGIVLPGLNRQSRIDHTLHPGYAARMRATSEGASRKEGEQAFRKGMRHWQDDYHSRVSASFGHERIGPKRKRWRRDDALARQAASDSLSCIQGFAARALDLLAHEQALAGPAVERIVNLVEMCRQAQNHLHAGGLVDWNEIAGLLDPSTDHDGPPQRGPVGADDLGRPLDTDPTWDQDQTEDSDDLRPDELHVNNLDDSDVEFEMDDAMTDDEESEPDFPIEADWDGEPDLEEK